MYHCLAVRLGRSCRTTPAAPEDVVDEPGEPASTEEEERRRRRRPRSRRPSCRRPRSGRPGDLLHLRPRRRVKNPASCGHHFFDGFIVDRASGFRRSVIAQWQGQEGLEPPTSVLETAALPIRATPLLGSRRSDLSLFVGRVLAAEAAVLRQLELLGVRLLVLGRRVVPALADGAREPDVLAAWQSTPRHSSRRWCRRRRCGRPRGWRTAAPSPSRSACSVTSRFTLSPGITISTPSGNFAAPVTSVVRKKTAADTREKRRVPPALFLLQHVRLAP